MELKRGIKTAGMSIGPEIRRSEQAEGPAADASLRKRYDRARRTIDIFRARKEAMREARKAGDEEALLAVFCRTLVKIEGYPLVWVGFLEGGEDAALKVVSQMGEGFPSLVGEAVALDKKRDGGADSEFISLLLNDVPAAVRNVSGRSGPLPFLNDAIRARCEDFIALPMSGADGFRGVLCIYSAERDAFDEEETQLLLEVAGDLAYAVVMWRAQQKRQEIQAELDRQSKELAERVRHLNCLYGVSKVIEESEGLLDHIFRGSANRIHESWRNPGDVCARIHFEGRTYESGGMEEAGRLLQSEKLFVNGRAEGRIEIFARGGRPEGDREPSEGELDLTRALAERLGRMADRTKLDEERKMLQERIFEIRKLESIGQLAGGFSHEFNNIMAAIMGNAQLGEAQVEPSGPGSQEFRNILRISKRARDLSVKLASFSSQSKVAVEVTPVDALIKDADLLLRPKMGRGLTARFHCDDPTMKVKIDRGQIQQAIQGLLANAVEAVAKEGGEILMDARIAVPEDWPEDLKAPESGARHCLIRVKDNGCGMSRQTARQAFEPFFTTKGMAKHSGLGLSMALGVVQGHGGVISIASAPGEGSVVNVFLPLEEAREPQARPKAEKEPAEAKAGREGLILIVDDEFDVRSVLDRCFTRAGYRTLAAESGAEAIGLFSQHREKIDLVALDMVMPEMGGPEVFYALKEMDPNVKVLIVSGYCKDGQASELLNDGALGFVQKPFDIRALLDEVKKAVASAPPSAP